MHTHKIDINVNENLSQNCQTLHSYSSTFHAAHSRLTGCRLVYPKWRLACHLSKDVQVKGTRLLLHVTTSCPQFCLSLSYSFFALLLTQRYFRVGSALALSAGCTPPPTFPRASGVAPGFLLIHFSHPRSASSQAASHRLSVSLVSGAWLCACTDSDNNN